MTRLWTPLLGASLLALTLTTAVQAGHSPLKTLESAVEVVHGFADLPLPGVPHMLRHDVAGIAIIPHVVKAGLIFDERFGRGVVLVRRPDGFWSHPIFIELTGAGVGVQAGVEVTDLVLVFRTPHSLDRILKGKGKLTLGSDVTVAAGPLGGEAGTAADALLRAEILSYSHSRGLFAGVSLEGDKLTVDGKANEAFYGKHHNHAAEIMSLHEIPNPLVVESLKEKLIRLSGQPVMPPHRGMKRE
jgi:lipid-binding SYLF domain-containing protein